MSGPGPHPDEVAVAAGALRYYGGTTGPMGDEAVRHVLLEAEAWRERQAAIERMRATWANGGDVAAVLADVRQRTLERTRRIR